MHSTPCCSRVAVQGNQQTSRERPQQGEDGATLTRRVAERPAVSQRRRRRFLLQFLLQRLLVQLWRLWRLRRWLLTC